jgi:hypothetical protein
MLKPYETVLDLALELHEFGARATTQSKRSIDSSEDADLRIARCYEALSMLVGERNGRWHERTITPDSRKVCCTFASLNLACAPWSASVA